MTDYLAAAPAPPSWREQMRQDRLDRGRLDIEREAARSREQIAALDAAETRRAARARAQREERAATAAAMSGWVSAHVLDLVFVPVIIVPGILSWSAMSLYGMSLYGGAGVLLPLFSEFSMWAFAIATALTRRDDARRRETDPAAGPSPVWHLQLGIAVFAAFAAALNLAHGLSPGPHHGPLTGAVMAVISVAGVIAHQIIKAVRRRSRTIRDEARIASAVRARVLNARLAAVKEAGTELDTGGMVRLRYRADIPAPEPDIAADTVTYPQADTSPDNPADSAPDVTEDTDTAPDPDADPDTQPDDHAAPDPDTSPDRRRAPARTRRGPSNAARVVAMRDKHPDESAADLARRLKLSDRTVRRHLAGLPENTPAAA